MRILYVDFNATSFLWRTRNLIPTVMAGAADTTFFGPGYVSGETLRRGLLRFVDANGPFDLAVTNGHVLFAEAYRVSPETFHRYYEFTCPPDDMTSLPALASEFERLTIPRVGLVLESDLHNWTAVETDALERSTDYVIGNGPEFIEFKANLPNLPKEKFFEQVTDRWASWTRAHAHRMASSMHFVGETEFNWDRLAHRSHDWSVAGVQYHARRTAARTLRDHGLAPLKDTRWRRGMGLLKKLGVMRKETRTIQRAFNADFQRRLESCRYAYTCGSGYGLAIRKFVEIPAAGAVLVSGPFVGFGAAGFRHGENAIACEPEQVMDAHRMLQGDPERAQRIADAGRDLVLRQHSTVARTAQFRETLASMADRSFAGARWENGRYVVTRRQGAAP